MIGGSQPLGGAGVTTKMETGPVTFSVPSSDQESFNVEDLYELQRRNGRMKPPVISYEQRNRLKAIFWRQEAFDYSFVRAVHTAFQDFGSLSSCMLWNPMEGFYWLRYTLFGSSAVDNIVSGRERMARLRPANPRLDVREMLERSYNAN